MIRNRIIAILLVLSLILIVLCVSDMDAHLKGIILAISIIFAITEGNCILADMKENEKEFMNKVDDLFTSEEEQQKSNDL
jgi:hypothetical protein